MNIRQCYQCLGWCSLGCKPYSRQPKCLNSLEATLRTSHRGHLVQNTPVSMRRLYWVAGFPTPTGIVYVTPIIDTQYTLAGNTQRVHSPEFVTSMLSPPVVRTRLGSLCLEGLAGPCGDKPARNLAARLRSCSSSSLAPRVARKRVAKGTDFRTNLDMTECRGNDPSNGTKRGRTVRTCSLEQRALYTSRGTASQERPVWP